MDVMSVFFDEDQRPRFRDPADQRAAAWETLDHAQFMEYCRDERVQNAGHHEYDAPHSDAPAPFPDPFHEPRGSQNSAPHPVGSGVLQQDQMLERPDQSRTQTGSLVGRLRIIDDEEEDSVVPANRHARMRGWIAGSDF